MVTSTVNFGADASVNATTLSNPATPAQPGRIRRALNALWRAAEYAGEQRGAAYLNHLADSCAASKPESARRMRAAANGHHFD